VVRADQVAGEPREEQVEAVTVRGEPDRRAPDCALLEEESERGNQIARWTTGQLPDCGKSGHRSSRLLRFYSVRIHSSPDSPWGWATLQFN